MKAAVIEQHGGAECIKVREVPTPKVGSGEVLLAVKAAALNHLDLWVVKGGRTALPFPWVLGSDGAGVIAEVGHGVSGWKVGDEVVLNTGMDRCDTRRLPRHGEHRRVDAIVGMSRPGTLADYVAVPEYLVHPKRRHLSFEQSAAASLDHITAWRMLFSRAQVQPGETVLIHGIGGGMALAALQFCVVAGARTIVTSSREEKLARAKTMGAVAGINYRTTADVAQAVRAAAGGEGADVAIDSVGAETWPINFDAVRPGGRIVHCGVTSGAEVTANIRKLYWNQLTVMGSTMGSQEEFADMLRAVEAAGIEPVIDSTYPLDDVRAAATRMEAGEQFGKIVVRVAE